MYNLSQK